MHQILQLEVWQYVMCGVAGFVLGRLTAPDPWQRVQDRKDSAARSASRLKQYREAGWFDEVRVLMRQKKKIHAIKLVRQQTGLGLKDAKDFVEHLDS